jgi:hypothetical protein
MPCRGGTPTAEDSTEMLLIVWLFKRDDIFARQEGRSRIKFHCPYFSGEDSLASNKAGAFLL